MSPFENIWTIVESSPSHWIADADLCGRRKLGKGVGMIFSRRSAKSTVISTASVGSIFGSCLAMLEAIEGTPYNEASLAPDTVPECNKSTLKLGPALIPLMHKSGNGSPLWEMNPSIAKITQSQGVPSIENNEGIG